MRTKVTLASAATAAIAVAALGLGAGSAPASAATSYTLTTVKAHAVAKDCWAAINGSVYNLTAWIPKHPGGQAVIKSMCGRDASIAFASMHGAAAKPAAALAKFRIGALASDTATSSASATATPTASSTASASASASATASASTALTAAVVKTHSTATDCWTIINGKVYNLTSWVTLHPGGQSVIKALCGANGTAAFTNYHGTKASPNNTLAKYLVGALAATDTTTATPADTQTATTSYTAAQVAAHKTATDCWTVIKGGVYDMTGWISKHPGGRRVIIAACGHDATRVFASERVHARASNQQKLAAFRVGTFDATAGALPGTAREEEDDD